MVARVEGVRPDSRNRRGDAIALVLIVLAVGLLALKWTNEAIWTPDALFYQARVLEIRGESKSAALDEAWQGPLSVRLRGAYAKRPPGASPLDDPRWIPESAKLYERR